MYFILIIEAIFTPRRLSNRIKCQHPDLREHMIDVGMSKRFWCLDCEASWEKDGIAA